MSALDNAIQSINTAADRTTNTAEFVDQLSTYDDISDVTNPNTGVTVPSLQKKTRLVAEAAFAESETQINQAVSDAELAALSAQSSANYDTEFVDGVTSAIKGKSYLYNGSMWACLNNTTEAPAIGNVNWHSLANHGALTNRDDANAHPASSISMSNGNSVEDEVKKVESRLLGVGVEIYRGSNGRYVQNGDVVPSKNPPYTHLTILINGVPEDVAMSSIASGVVASLTEIGATIGGTAVTLHQFRNGGYQATDAQLATLTPRIGEQWFNATNNTVHLGDGVTPGGNIITANCATFSQLASRSYTEGAIVKTQGYYTMGDGGGAEYTVKAQSYAPDGYSSVALNNGLVAYLNLSDSGFADFRQVGVKVFDSITDPDFETVDAGVIFNALNSSHVLGLKSSTYGKVHLKTQYIDEKGMYFVAPKPSKIDTAEESSFEIVADSGTVFTNTEEGPFVIKSGVRRGGIVGVVLTEGTGAEFEKLFSFGDARYNDDTSNIISNYYTDGFITRGGGIGIFAYQYFNCKFLNTQNRNFRSVAWWTEEGGTSCHWVNCFPLSNEPDTKGFVWNPDVETQGHIYSSMTGCAPQLVSDESYIFRNCNMTLNACGEEFSSYNSDSTMLFVGTGNYVVNGYTLVNQNANKPQNIYGVKPTPSGRFGASLSIDGTSLGVSNFTGDSVGFMYYGTEPTSILSRARWDISNINQKSDPTNAIDYDTWQSGYYYNKFVILKEQLEKIETYTRSGQNTALISIDQNTRHTITGEITTASGSAYVTFEVDTGSKPLTSGARVDVVSTAGADTTNRGKIFHIDSGTDSTYATGNVYLRSFHKAGVDIFASFSSGVLRIEFEASSVIEGQTGIWTITKRRSANS